MVAAGYTETQAEAVKKEVQYFENVRSEVKHGSGDFIDLKLYEPAMRHLIDSYIQAKDSEKVSTLDDMTLIQLIVERGVSVVDAFPKGLSNNPEAIAEAITNNVRRLIIDQTPINPKYYEEMSVLLDALIEKRRIGAKDYREFLEELSSFAKRAETGESISSNKHPGQACSFRQLNKDEILHYRWIKQFETTKRARLDRSSYSRRKRYIMHCARYLVMNRY